ncbi:hypothetical protein Tsubulata_049920 [Turnera subulata]|uniref:Uncharacterized protein n=1 Tax=Turnera subulata TaxID=218843 RepID=A0A9Q0J4R9_9ROSI|nr:hypothetical protein Tsubulata_049920 [Turnera subulata]
MYTQKNIATLQLLKNELAMLTQGGMSISKYFLRVNNLCKEISELDPDQKISEASQRRFLIRGLKKKYTSFVTSIQGWASQTTIEELESLLANQEALAELYSRSCPVLKRKTK